MISVSSDLHVTVTSPSVFIINFSWKHSGIWSVIRFAFLMFRTAHTCIPPEPLPSSPGLGLPSRIQFIIGSSFRPEKLCTSALVPRVFPRVKLFFNLRDPPSIYLLSDYGGHLPRLPELPNLLDTTPHVISFSPSRISPNDKDNSASLPQESSADYARRRKITSFAHLSPRSRFNPFYGYPIDPSPHSSTLHYLRYGRRRKRDLIRTLVALWWERWRFRVSWTFSLLFIFSCARWWLWWRQRRKSVFSIRGRPNEV